MEQILTTPNTSRAKEYLCTLCNTPDFTLREAQVTHVQADELADYLDHYGCYDELDDAIDLGIGQSFIIGFPQASYHGLIITRIL